MILSKRKIVKIGSSYFISLPIKWVEKYGLKEGDIIQIIISSNIIILNPNRAEKVIEKVANEFGL